MDFGQIYTKTARFPLLTAAFAAVNKTIALKVTFCNLMY